jgi:DNA-binding transcriptional LysR family regulator
VAGPEKTAKNSSGHSQIDGTAKAASLDWDDFRIFTTSAREGSFTRTAQKLRMTQSAVSKRMKRLEKAVGARLFDRGQQGVKLTSEGERLLRHANGAETMLSRGVSSVREGVRRVDGECKLITGDGLGSYWLPAFMPFFAERNPATNLVLFTSPDLGANQTPPFDLQIHYTHPLSETRVAVPLATLHFVLFASPQYLHQFGFPKSTQDLRHHRIADSTFRLGEKGSLANWAGLDEDVAMATNSSVILFEMIRNGSTLGLMPTYTALVDPRLVPVLPELHFHAPLFLCFESESRAKPAVRATIDYLKEFVFDRQRMPWFFEHFVAPQKDWKRIYDSCLERASGGETPHAATGS